LWVTHRQTGDLINVLSFLESRLKIVIFDRQRSKDFNPPPPMKSDIELVVFLKTLLTKYIGYVNYETDSYSLFVDLHNDYCQPIFRIGLQM
jgi:hypothetical protein